MADRVLVTGHKGYIGSVMVPFLLEHGYEVVGLDAGYFDECTLVPDEATVPMLHRDLRDVMIADLKGFSTIIHLAALSNDPIGNLSDGWTREINVEGSVRLAEMAKKTGVERFLFSSSCIMYGVSETGRVTEASALDPRTMYARSKVEAEKGISALAGDGFAPVFLRNGTVYGLSPRMRFDTVLNDLVGRAVTSGRVVVLSDGAPWRPVIHVQDLIRAFREVLEAPLEDVAGEIFNVGADELNIQVRDLARLVVEEVPGSELEIRGESGADQRTYQADFGKFSKTFHRFRFRWTPREGVRELYASFQRIGLTRDSFTDPRFTRLKWLKRLLESGRLDSSLRWRGEGLR